MATSLFTTLNQALQNREHRAAMKQYEKQHEKYEEKCKAVAKEVVTTILNDIANGDDMNYIMVICQESYSFSTASVALNNQRVKRALAFPQAPERPANPNEVNASIAVRTKSEPVAWRYIRTALEEAGIPTKELRLDHDLVIFISLESIGSSKIYIPNKDVKICKKPKNGTEECEFTPADEDDEGFTPAYDVD